MLAVNP